MNVYRVPKQSGEKSSVPSKGAKTDSKFKNKNGEFHEPRKHMHPNDNQVKVSSDVSLTKSPTSGSLRSHRRKSGEINDPVFTADYPERRRRQASTHGYIICNEHTV